MASRVRELFDSPKKYIESVLWIRDKFERVVPFSFNPIQERVYRRKAEIIASGRKPRFIYLKYRRGGITTFEQGLTFHRCATRRNVQALLLAHDHESTELLFRAANFFYDKLPDPFKPRRLTQHNKRNLDFVGINSLYTVGTAGKHSLGRGATFGKVHWSEMAFSPGGVTEQENLLASIDEATSHGEVVIESTSNGIDNLFHKLCCEAMKGKGPWNLLFLPWFDDPLNRLPLSKEQAAEVMASLDPEEKDLAERRGLDAEQIAWRREKKAARGILFPQEFPEDPETCFLTVGISFFDTAKLQALARRGFKAPIERREISGHRKGTGGVLERWVKPQAGRRYVAGCDTAGGSAGGNESVCTVVDIESCEQVACLSGRWRPEDFGRLCAKLAMEYNRALLAVEDNNHGHSVLNTLVNEIGYPNLYYAVEYSTGKKKREPGWHTDGKTRSLMLNDLREAVETGWLGVNDPSFVSQCLTFKLDKDEEKYKAAKGCHDDKVISMAIALQARKDPDSAPVRVSQNLLDRKIVGVHKPFGWPEGRVF